MKRAAGLVFWLLAACARPNGDERHDLRLPPRDGFEAVGDVLHARCGSLDCHGQPGRNLRIYGKDGLRLDPGDRPGLDGGVTEQGEHDANYEAAAGLEPELTALVFREGGAHPERLTLVRKARAEEAHEGNAAAPRNSAADRCITSWLTGAIDAEACGNAAHYPRPETR